MPNGDELLASCYCRSLDVVGQLNVRSIAFPAISTDIYGFPRECAAKIAVREVLSYSGAVERVIFVCFDAETAGIYRGLLTTYKSAKVHSRPITRTHFKVGG